MTAEKKKKQRNNTKSERNYQKYKTSLWYHQHTFNFILNLRSILGTYHNNNTNCKNCYKETVNNRQ